MFPYALALVVLCKPWNGITPGVSTKEDVVRRFGEPSKVVTNGGRDVLAYQKGKLIKGTTQTQFRVDPQRNVVERIDVFPEPVLSLEDVEKGYGPACTVKEPETAEKPCYLRHDDGQKLYLVYVRLGVAVFFTPDKKSVQTFAFLPEKADAK